jgi:hypothetical protein
MAREGRFSGWQKNPHATVSGIVDEDRLRKSELHRDCLASFLGDGGTI